MEQIKELLKQIPEFEELESATLDDFIAAGKEVTYMPGEVLWVETDTSDVMGVILAGEVQFESALNNETPVVELGVGEVVGIVNFFADINVQSPITVTAKSKVTLFSWSVEDVKTLFARNTALGYAVACHLGGKLMERMQAWGIHVLNNVSWGIE